MSPPRIAPGPADGLPEGVPHWNVFTTLARHPKLFRDWLRFGGRLLAGGELPARDRELLILRTAIRCEAPYEWGQHVRIGLGSGLARDEIDRVPAGPDAPGWSDHDATLLRAADELHDTSTLSDATWAALADRYGEHELIEVVMLVGHYHMVAFALNAFGVELDEGLEPLP
jgi:4-carboxymuconolactone decarboxylase